MFILIGVYQRLFIDFVLKLLLVDIFNGGYINWFVWLVCIVFCVGGK